MSFILDVKVIKQKEVVQGHYRLTISCAEVAGAAIPGQFLHLRCGNTLDPLLRRPLSIHAVNREKREVSLLYRVAGKGTSLLSDKKKGETVSLVGPLGNGFSMPQSPGKVFVVAGGIGIAPLYFLLQELSALNHSAEVFLGAATGNQLFLSREIKKLGHKVFLATDDGSAGFPGTVAGLFERHMENNFKGSIIPDSRVYSCGPPGMLKRLCEIIELAGIHGEISLEERMGCGVGACLSCACKIADGKGGFQYKRTCVEGPVFPAGEVVWE